MGFEESKSQSHCLPFLLQMATLEFVRRGESDNVEEQTCKQFHVNVNAILMESADFICKEFVNYKRTLHFFFQEKSSNFLSPRLHRNYFEPIF